MNDLQKYKKNVKSQWGEDGIIEEIFNRITTKSKVCVEFGAWDGKYLSNTWDLCFNKGWRGILVESNPEKSEELKKNCENKNINVINTFVTPQGVNSIDSVIDKIGDIQKIDLMSIDVDGNEYQIFENLTKYQPRVLVIEYNPTFPPHIKMIQERDQYMGSSALSMCELAEKKGYALVAITNTNLFFVTLEDFPLLNIPIQKLEDIFIWDYINFLVTSYDGIPFLVGRPPYFSLLPNKHYSKRIMARKLRTPKFSSSVPLMPVFISGNMPYLSCLGAKIKGWIKKIILKIIHKKITNNLAKILIEIKWRAMRMPSPPPHFIKLRIIKNYAKKFAINVFIETGTYRGDTTMSLGNIFNEIYSIELDKSLFEKARNKFATYPHVHIFQGDSSKVLPSILSRIDKPALFWLDGHYSGGITSKGDLNTPILNELKLILNHKIKNHVILIDDARCFVGKDDYPNLNRLKQYIFKKNKKYKFKVENDIIRLSC